MTYKETLDYLYSQLPMYQRIGPAAYKPNLDNTLALCTLLNHPDREFESVHIAGTNGKGSSSHLLAAILQEAGYKVGLYTSPHLKDFRERIRVNGKMIAQQAVVQFVEKHKKDFERIKPSFFEMTVGLAFDYFKQQKVDIAVIETGLGGRLDSTNVIHPLVSLITNISFDHQNLLGNTLKKIAQEKAGIIKPGVPVVIAQQQPEVKRVFELQAKKTKSPLWFADAHFNVKEAKQVRAQDKLFLKGNLMAKGVRQPVLKGFRSELPGLYQTYNIVGVAKTVEVLQELGWIISKKAVKSGLEKVSSLTGLQGRWQVLGHQPLVIADTAHNEAGIGLVMQQIKRMQAAHLHFVIGVVNDKDLRSVLALLPRKATYYFCKPSVPRGLDALVLQGHAAKFGLSGQIYSSVKSALRAAKSAAQSKDLIYVGGSTFVVGDAL